MKKKWLKKVQIFSRKSSVWKVFQFSKFQKLIFGIEKKKFIKKHLSTNFWHYHNKIYIYWRCLIFTKRKRKNLTHQMLGNKNKTEL